MVVIACDTQQCITKSNSTYVCFNQCCFPLWLWILDSSPQTLLLDNSRLPNLKYMIAAKFLSTYAVVFRICNCGITQIYDHLLHEAGSWHTFTTNIHFSNNSVSICYELWPYLQTLKKYHVYRVCNHGINAIHRNTITFIIGTPLTIGSLV